MKNAIDLELNESLMPLESAKKHEKTQCLKALAFQSVASCCTFLMMLCVKISTSEEGVSSSQLLAVRGYMTMLFGLYVIKKERLDLSRIRDYKATLLARMILGFLANYMLNAGIELLNLSMATTVFNINPLIGVLLGGLIFKEKITRLQVITLFITFAGVILLLKPCLFTGNCEEASQFNVFLIFPLLAAVLRAFVMVGVRKCKDIHWIFPTLALNLAFCIVSPTALFFSNEYTPFTWKNSLVMVMGGIFGIGSNTFTAKSLQVGEMGLNLPLSYMTVIFSSIADVLVFNVAIKWNQWAGAAVIFSGIICVTYVKFRQSQRSK